MKNFILLFMAMVAVCCFSGCNDKYNYVLNNMSDLRINYFEGKNQEIFVNLSCGYREDIFVYNGVSTTPVECGVISLAFINICTYNSVEIVLIVDGKSFEYVLEKSPYEDVFMEDIGKILNSNSKITIKLKNQKQELELECLSNNFKIDYKKAIKIACEHFKNQINGYYFNNKFNAEAYLKILSKKDYENKYWYFSLIGTDGKNYSTLIDCYTGEVIAKTNAI